MWEHKIWQEVIERFEQQAPGAVMAHLALDQALPSSWIDEVFQAHRRRQYPRELLFSSVVELMLLVTLGLRPSLHAAARKMADRLPVSLTALYAKVQRTEPAVLRALVQGSAKRLVPLVGCLPERQSLPGWQLRVFDGNHLPASQKRLAPLRGFRGAALPGHTLLVYDPDSALVCDIVACEDAHESERTGAAALIERAQAQQVWIGDRHFCTQAIMQGLAERGAGCIVREHARHPRLRSCGPWSEQTDIETGRVREQAIELAEPHAGALRHWRRIEIALHAPTESGDDHAARIRDLRKRQSELHSLAHVGALQLQSWITEDSVEASHSEVDMLSLIRLCNYIAFMAAVEMIHLADGSLHAHLAKIEELHANGSI